MTSVRGMFADLALPALINKPQGAKKFGAADIDNSRLLGYFKDETP